MKHGLYHRASWLWLFTAFSLGVSFLPCLAQTASPNSSDSLEPIDRPVILGQPRENPYVVAIPTRDVDLVDRVQTYAPLAFFTASRLGTYIQAGSFPDRASAEQLGDRLREYDFDARVIYRRVRN
jgi:SPOR domain